jgi:hypothetical protein
MNEYTGFIGIDIGIGTGIDRVTGIGEDTGTVSTSTQ